MQAGSEACDEYSGPQGCLRDCPTEVLSVATAQAPRRRRPDRTITVTAPLRLALCNVLSHWLKGKGSDWADPLLIPEVFQDRKVTSNSWATLAFPSPELFLFS